MSSTSNVQNLLVNVIRPTYRWESGTGFVPSVVLSNITEVIAGRVTTSALVVSDSKVNTYIGSNAGLFASNTFSNVGIGYSAMGGASNAQSNVAIGTFALEGASNVNSNVAIGAGTDISGAGDRNVLIGTNVVVASGSNNILIGTNITRANESNKLQIGPLLYGDICQGYIGINNPNPQAALDISGFVVFRDKVGFQNPNPQYSLDVTGSVGVSERFFGGPGSVTAPIYSFSNSCNSGLYVPPVDTSLGTSVAGVGAFGIVVNSNPAAIFASNKVQFFQNLDVSGTFSACNVNIGAFSVVDGNANGPSITFTNDTSLGLFRAGTGILGITSGGVQRVTLSNGFLGIGTATPRVALDVSGDISANVYNGPGGTAGAPHYTFSDDRTTGLFFPGSNMVALTAGGTERMRISNNRIGIGTTAPANALDVSGVLRVIGANGNITFSNGTVDISGTQVFNASGTLSNASTTSNRIGGVLLTNADLSAERIFAPVIRNAVTPSLFDISGGNIYFASNISNGNASSTNTIGNVVLTAGVVQAGDPGSATRTSFGFGAGTGEGMYRPTTSQLAFATAGVERIRISNSNVGIATSTPTTALDVSGATRSINFLAAPGGAPRPAYAFTADPSSGLDLVGTSYLAFDTSGVQRMCISGDFVGIATTAPVVPLDVCSGTSTIGLIVRQGGTQAGVGIQVSNAQGTLDLGVANDAGGFAANANPGDAVLRTPATRRLLFNANGVGGRAALTISGDYVGVGCINTNTFPGHLDVSGALRVARNINGNNSVIQIADSASGNPVIRHAIAIFNTPTGSGNGGGDLAFNTFNDSGAGLVLPAMLIRRSNGNVGIGTTAPGTLLDVSGAVRVTNSKALFDVIPSGGSQEYANVTQNGYLTIYKAGTTNKALSNQMVNLSPEVAAPTYFLSNSVGIGTSAPNYRLDVSTEPTTASINMSTWPRYGASVSYYGVYGGANGDARTWTTSNAMSADIMTVGDSNGTYFRMNKSGIYSFNVWLGGTTSGNPLVYLDVSTNIGHNNINVGQNPELAMNQTVSGSARASLSWTGFLPSNSTYYYKIKVSAIGSIATGPTGGKIYVCFLGEVASGAGVPF